MTNEKQTKRDEMNSFVREKLTFFGIVTNLSKWDNVLEDVEYEAVRIYRELDPFLSPDEANLLREAWSSKRHKEAGSAEKMTKLLDTIAARFPSNS